MANIRSVPAEVQQKIAEMRASGNTVAEIRKTLGVSNDSVYKFGPVRVARPKKVTTSSRIGRVHAYIPDIQTKPGVPNEHLSWIANYLVEKRPDVIIQAGDFADMPSLSSYALGKAEAEGTRYIN